MEERNIHIARKKSNSAIVHVIVPNEDPNSPHSDNPNAMLKEKLVKRVSDKLLPVIK